MAMSGSGAIPRPDRRPIDDPAGEPLRSPGEGTERPRPRPSNDPDVVPPRDGEEERRPRPGPEL